jgi:hypothetical protein
VPEIAAPFLNAHFWWHTRAGIKVLHPLNSHQHCLAQKIIMLHLNALCWYLSLVHGSDHLWTRTWLFWTESMVQSKVHHNQWIELIVQFEVLQNPLKNRTELNLTISRSVVVTAKALEWGLKEWQKWKVKINSKFDVRLNTAIYLMALYGVISYHIPYHQACFPRSNSMVTVTVIWVPYSCIVWWQQTALHHGPSNQ